MPLTAIRADITTLAVDAIVNAANTGLMGGGGVDGAIHRRGGPEIVAACRALRAGPLRDGLPTGRAVATTAGLLPARWVIHTVGPVWSDSEDRSGLLTDCHRNSLAVAAELGAASVAFPAISTGIYRWPLESAAEIALAAVRDSEIELIRFVLFDDHAYQVFSRACA